MVVLHSAGVSEAVGVVVIRTRVGGDLLVAADFARETVPYAAAVPDAEVDIRKEQRNTDAEEELNTLDDAAHVVVVAVVVADDW